MKHRVLLDKIMLIGFADMFIIGYWTSHTSFIRGTVDMLFLVGGVFFVDFMILVMWDCLKNG